MLGLKLNHISKSGHWSFLLVKDASGKVEQKLMSDFRNLLNSILLFYHSPIMILFGSHFFKYHQRVSYTNVLNKWDSLQINNLHDFICLPHWLVSSLLSSQWFWPSHCNSREIQRPLLWQVNSLCWSQPAVPGWHHNMETISALLALWTENLPSSTTMDQ